MCRSLPPPLVEALPAAQVAYPLEVGFGLLGIPAVPSEVATRLRQWGVAVVRRYSDFVALHRRLRDEEGVPESTELEEPEEQEGRWVLTHVSALGAKSWRCHLISYTALTCWTRPW